VLSGLFFGLSYMIMYVVIGLVVYLAILFKIHNNLSSDNIFSVIFLITFAGMTAGNSLMYLPDMSSAKQSLRRIFCLLNQKDEDELRSLLNNNPVYA
jgi:ABC-type siderophore export system fused ATPase/permease subunit